MTKLPKIYPSSKSIPAPEPRQEVPLRRPSTALLLPRPGHCAASAWASVIPPQEAKVTAIRPSVEQDQLSVTPSRRRNASILEALSGVRRGNNVRDGPFGMRGIILGNYVRDGLGRGALVTGIGRTNAKTERSGGQET